VLDVGLIWGNFEGKKEPAQDMSDGRYRPTQSDSAGGGRGEN